MARIDSSWFETVHWAAALELEERAEIFKAHRDALDPAAFDAQKATRNFRKWCAQKPFDDRANLEKRLHLDGLKLEDFKALLGLDPKALAPFVKDKPPWLQILAASYRSFESSKPFSPEKLKASPGVGFCYLTQPLTDHVIAQVEAKIGALAAKHDDLPLDAETGVRLFLEPLFFLLMRTMNKVLILELNIERLQDHLDGDTPQDRFSHFLEKLRDPTYSLGILREYPVLARKLSGIALRWQEAREEFLERLADDWQAICQHFFAGEHPGKLVAIEDAGDRHCGGRAVAVLTFDSGKKLVYKPRDLGIDEQFFTILTWLDGQCDWGFEPMKVLQRGHYGWVAFVEHRPCENRQDIALFYQRLGGLLALLYLLQASDFHYENLIAAGDMPQLIDLESFFTPYFASKDESWMSVMGKSMVDSVLQTGLLPWRIFLGKKDRQGLDISGVTNVADTRSNQYAPFWENEGADDMHLSFRQHKLKQGKNRPTLNGEDISLLDFEAPFIQGFETVYRLLMAHRDQLQAPDGLILGQNHENRVLTRMTLGYSYLLNQSYHPDMLRDGLDQDRHWDGLWMGLDRQPLIPRFVRGEREALRQADIPVFTNRPWERHLYWPDGGVEKDFFPGTSMQRVISKFERLSEEDLQTQIWFIRGSLATLRAEQSQAIQYRLHTQCEPVSTKALMEQVEAVAAHLENHVKEQHGESNWINLCLLGESGYHLQPMGIDLYSGLPGLILFYGYLGKVTGERRYVERAKSAAMGMVSYLRIMRGRAADVREGPAYDIGAFQGYGGVIYALAHAAAIWSDHELLDELNQLTAWVRPLIAEDENNDLISGSAGLLLGLLALHSVKANDDVLDMAVQCGDRLLQSAHREMGGLCWKGSSGVALTGLSHGAAGIAYALILLAARTGEDRFKSAGQAALAFERANYQAQYGNWADLRKFDAHLTKTGDGEIEPMCAWCNGASGIGLSRLMIRDTLDDDVCDRELDTAVETTLAKGFGRSHCLCHGDVGNLEFLSLASSLPRYRHLREPTLRIAQAIVSSIEELGWVCGVPNHFQAMGLMTGMTGIGYGLMRFAHPDLVPSVLVLEPPRLYSMQQSRRMSEPLSRIT